jgi:hypothetical protein
VGMEDGHYEGDLRTDHSISQPEIPPNLA